MTEFNPYKILGIRKNAALKRIKSAFRQKVKAAHPDAGGNAQDFLEINRAYRLLIDPEKRKRYDDTGEVDEGTDLSLESKIAGLLAAMFESVLDQGLAMRKDVDIIKSMGAHVGVQIEKLREQREKAGEAIQALEGVKKRLARVDGKNEPNIFVAVTDKKIDALRERGKNIADQLTVFEATLTELDNYECLTDVVTRVVTTQRWVTGTTSTA